MARPSRFCYKEVAPFIALLMVQFAEVGVSILFKEATLKGLSYYVFILYSSALSNLVLLISLPFILRSCRSTGLPAFNFSLLCKFFSLGLILFSAQLCGYIGIEYSSPTLSSAMGTLLPAFIFIFAVLFRMEEIALRSSSSLVKILGTITSIAGALIVVLYKGQKILNAASPSLTPSLNSPLGSSSQGNWIIGGFLLAAASLLMSIWNILMTHVIKLYPSKLIVICLLNLFGTIIAAPVCFLAERNLSAWRLKLDITLVAVIYTALTTTLFCVVVHIWGLQVKGPVYVSLFKPLSIVIAAAMSFIFLGEALYIGSVVGAVILSIGFYSYIWGKAKEEKLHADENCQRNSGSQSSSTVPLLQGHKEEDI